MAESPATMNPLFIPRRNCMYWSRGTCHKGDACTFLHLPQLAFNPIAAAAAAAAGQPPPPNPATMVCAATI
jgi:hypothetical protein